MKILYLSRWFPYPQDNGSKIRVFNLIKYLAVRHSIDLLSFSSEPVDRSRIDEMCKYCNSVETEIFKEYPQGKLKTLRNLLSPVPNFLHRTHNLDMQRRVERAVEDQEYDLVIANQMSMVPYAMAIPVPCKVFEEIELTVFYEKYWLETQKIKRWRNWLTWVKATRYIASSLESLDAGTVVSEIERQRVSQIYSGASPICIIPNGVEISEEQNDFGPPTPDTLVFSGSLTYEVNLDAMAFFMKEIFPLIKADRPGVKILVTGKLNGVKIDELPHKDWITFTGFLEDVRPTVATSWASIVPLRKGGGTRLKIIEALSLGVPVITTSKGAEGLDLAPEEEIFIADEPETFADAVIKVLETPHLREQSGRAGQRKVRQKYDWKVIGPQFSSFVEGVVKDGGNN
jgi:polysaccharide biosynthesis protein PslH